MGCDDQAHIRSRWSEGNGHAIVKRSRHAAFWVDAHVARDTRKRLLNDFQIEKMVGTYNLSPFASLVARRADVIETTVRCWQRLRLRQRPLAGDASCSIHIHHRPLRSRSVEQTSGGSKGVAGQQILLKKRAQGLHCGLVESREIPGKG